MRSQNPSICYFINSEESKSSQAHTHTCSFNIKCCFDKNKWCSIDIEGCCYWLWANMMTNEKTHQQQRQHWKDKQEEKAWRSLKLAKGKFSKSSFVMKKIFLFIHNSYCFHFLPGVHLCKRTTASFVAFQQRGGCGFVSGRFKKYSTLFWVTAKNLFSFFENSTNSFVPDGAKCWQDEHRKQTISRFGGLRCMKINFSRG